MLCQFQMYNKVNQLYIYIYLYVYPLSHVQFFVICSPARLLCSPLIPIVCSDSCPLSQQCYLIISSSDTLFSFCLQSLYTVICIGYSPQGFRRFKWVMDINTQNGVWQSKLSVNDSNIIVQIGFINAESCPQLEEICTYSRYKNVHLIGFLPYQVLGGQESSNFARFCLVQV